ncbi:hypothetical protein [Streptomyces hygroscopicus]|uniref:hypothetical protein n=1 Tax=Streptomyces hygroscopicus TaxID=1912 RepID=UPI001FCB4AF5|nr:hypothetical protein [Streptomyces hygroscopicus]BDH10486.1 hypothetical protein HOK021_16650 [Streptomyces hygroscopicus]
MANRAITRHSSNDDFDQAVTEVLALVSPRHLRLITGCEQTPDPLTTQTQEPDSLDLEALAVGVGVLPQQ